VIQSLMVIRKAGGRRGRWVCNTWRDPPACLKGLVMPEGATRGGRKSAEGVIVAAHGDEGPNVKDRKAAGASADEGGAGRMVKRPEDSRKVPGQTRRSTERKRQTSAAAQRNAQPMARMSFIHAVHIFHEPLYDERHVRWYGRSRE